MMLISLIFAAATATAPVAATPAIQNVASDSNKVVCRSEETTGTRLGAVRVCMTKAQWEERAAADRQVLDVNQGRSYQSGGTSH